MSGIEKTIKIVDPKGKVLAELTKIFKDVTVEEFKKMLVNLNPFRKLLTFITAERAGRLLRRHVRDLLSILI